MANLSNLEPQVVWNIFEQMCANPRPSKHEEKVSAWIQQLAKDHNVECKEDKVGNLILRKAATAGMKIVRVWYYKRTWTWFRKKILTPSITLLLTLLMPMLIWN